MIELIFVIIILGVLSTIAIPKLNATRDDAQNVKTLAALKSATNEIIGYAMAQGKIESNLSVMSSTLADLESSGLAVMGAYDMTIKSGSVANCLKLEINSTTLTSMSMSYGNTAADSSCMGIQEIVKTMNFNMDIRGANVAF